MQGEELERAENPSGFAWLLAVARKELAKGARELRPLADPLPRGWSLSRPGARSRPGVRARDVRQAPRSLVGAPPPRPRGPARGRRRACARRRTTRPAGTRRSESA